MAALTEKEIAIRNVILPNVKEKTMAEYYEGKIDGLKQAYESLGEIVRCLEILTNHSIESIKIEL